jgi:hypothetical protein
VGRSSRKRVFDGKAGLKDVKWHNQFGWFGDIDGLRLAVVYQIIVWTGA